MRTLHIITILGVTNFVAGSLLAVAFGQGSIQIFVAVVAISLVLAVAVTGWAIMKFGKCLRRLQDQTESESPDCVESGIVELDKVSQKFSLAMLSAKQKSVDDALELVEINELLAKLDRRDGAFDRDGSPVKCAFQLRNILRGYGAELEASIRQTLSCSREIRRTTEEIVGGAEVHSDSVNQTTAFIDNLASRIISVCDTANGALQSSTKAQGTARAGLQEFQKLIDEMKQVRNHAAARERKMQSLGQHIKEIDSIVQTIGTLSSRTDLLALNASIESVRAGEHGRGFAVVAEEVRALAEQSARAVLDIAARIEMIQLETHQSISVASGEHDQMHQVIQKITDTLEALREISGAADVSAKSLSEISTNTTEQLQLAQEIVNTLERCSDSSKKNRSNAEGVHWTAKTLTQVSTQLESSLQLFRLAGALPPAEHTNHDAPAIRATHEHSLMPAHVPAYSQ